MTEQLHYSISELAEVAVVTQRTIRYYTAEGLLPPPQTRGRYTMYGAEHRDRLSLIARLKAAYLPLTEIKTCLAALSAAEVAELVQTQAPELTTPTSASAYIGQVLRSGIPLPAAPPSRPALLHAPGFDVVPPPAPLAQPRPLMLGDAASPVPLAPATPKEGLLRRFLPGRVAESSAAKRVPTTETWQRIPVAPGVELHVSTTLDPIMRERVDQFMAVAQTLFAND